MLFPSPSVTPRNSLTHPPSSYFYEGVPWPNHPLPLPLTGTSSLQGTNTLLSHGCQTNSFSSTNTARDMGSFMCVPRLAVEIQGALVSWYFLSFHGATRTFNSFSLLSYSSIGNPVVSLMLSCEHPPLYKSGSGSASQKTGISGPSQHALLDIHNSACIWWLHLGGISKWDNLCTVSLPVSAPDIVSHFLLYFVSSSKKDWSTQTLVFLFLGLHVSEFCLGYCVILS